MKNDSGAKMVVVFTITEIKLFSSWPILQFCAPPFIFIFVIFSCLAGLCALIPQQRKKGPGLVFAQSYNPIAIGVYEAVLKQKRSL